MALGTLTAIDQTIIPGGPQFVDRVSLVGDASYPTNGTAGLQAALRALRKDNREIVSVKMYKVNNILHSVRFDPATGLLTAFLEDNVSGIVAEVGNAVSLAAVTYLLEIFSR